MRIEIKGQVRGGKNNQGMTRTGLKYPKPEFIKWRYETMAQIKAQIPRDFKPIGGFDYDWTFNYTPQDNRRRDCPAILDAVFHCLEKTGVVTDDRYIMNLHFILNAPSEDHPGIIIDVVEIVAKII